MSRFSPVFACIAFLLIYTPSSHATPSLSFMPAKPWHVSGGSMCTASTEYDNGFTVQFTGKNDAVTSLTLDVRQDVFNFDESYTAQIAPENSSGMLVNTNIVSPQKIRLNIVNGSSLYQKLQVSEFVDVMVDKNAFRFYLSELNAPGTGFISCVSPSTTTATYTPRGNDKSGLSYMGIEEEDAVMVNRDQYTAQANFTNSRFGMSQLENENMRLREELAIALREGETEKNTIQGNNWDLERATMMYNEAERQVQILGQKLKRQEVKHQAEITELEQMLFDPRVTNQEQMTRLAELENELAEAREELQLQRLRYDERIRMLESRLAQ